MVAYTVNYQDASGNSLAEVDMKNGCVTDTWERDPGTVFQNNVF